MGPSSPSCRAQRRLSCAKLHALQALRLEALHVLTVEERAEIDAIWEIARYLAAWCAREFGNDAGYVAERLAWGAVDVHQWH